MNIYLNQILKIPFSDEPIQRKQGVEIKYINGFVVCKELATEELAIFNKLAWDKCIYLSYKEFRKTKE